MTRPQDDTTAAAPAGYSVARSDELLARARRVDASLLARPGVLRMGPGDDGDRVPVFADRAQGPYLWDVDGNRYVDFVLAFGAVVLGHADPVVTAAVERELRRGVSPSLHRPVQAERCSTPRITGSPAPRCLATTLRWLSTPPRPAMPRWRGASAAADWSKERAACRSSLTPRTSTRSLASCGWGSCAA